MIIFFSVETIVYFKECSRINQTTVNNIWSITIFYPSFKPGVWKFYCSAYIIKSTILYITSLSFTAKEIPKEIYFTLMYKKRENREAFTRKLLRILQKI